MKNFTRLSHLLILIIAAQLSLGQGLSGKFKLEGTNPNTIEWIDTITANAEIYPFDENINRIYGLAVNASIDIKNQNDFSRRDKFYIIPGELMNRV